MLGLSLKTAELPSEHTDTNVEKEKKSMRCPVIARIKLVVFLHKYQIVEPVTLVGRRTLIDEIRKRPLEPDDKLVQVYVAISGEHNFHPKPAEFIATRLFPVDISSAHEIPALEENVQTDETIEET
ncbi:uncharacterized protein LOC127832179 [Dreissena polymorpha]|uniref:Uncharacterized protein n=1 Tax=Dreissena polymorpha TaxID=45954 RepID=A0A9D4JU80_DREPO|nr:uncharacterized protein LOC127832179 [Dreissena polymorpha]XP_052213440.1 uncharacterized protein LOC127832179 [Dreissena polymorpha]KAH3823114.1 hypothetical protein DPMN_124913 [Dreissena polymorpha]